jgi:osmoprotectant transport system substrate-binding protein
MRIRRKTVLISSFGIVASLALAACGSNGSGSGESAGSGQLDGVSITVGSKDFTENILLGEMLVQALEHEGATVKDQTNLGGTSVNRKALLSGDIDVYPDYNGTGWVVHLGQQDPSNDPTTLFNEASAMDLEKNNIKWVGTSPFNDTYGFAANGDLAKQQSSGSFDFQAMADYLKAHQDATLCLESEFPDRPDGLVLFEKATGYEVPQNQIKILDTGLIYTETAKGNCQFGEVYTTDGRITALDLSLVEDPGAMILYNLSFTFRNDVYEAHAAVYDDIAKKILDPLDNAKMAELNAQVDVEDNKPEDVAKSYLESIGLL